MTNSQPLVFGQPQQTTDSSRPAKARNDQYINISLPAVNGHGESTQSKLGNGIGLSMSRATEAKIIKARNEAKAAGREEDFIKWFRESIVIEFRNGDGSDASEVAVPSFGPVSAA
jgi:hypothetical protein